SASASASASKKHLASASHEASERLRQRQLQRASPRSSASGTHRGCGGAQPTGTADLCLGGRVLPVAWRHVPAAPRVKPKNGSKKSSPALGRLSFVGRNLRAAGGCSGRVPPYS